MSARFATKLANGAGMAQRHGRKWLHRVAGSVLMLGLAVGIGRADCAELNLVLAIDGSGSIGAGEFALQQAGYAAAFRSDRVQRALASAGVVNVAVVLWGDAAMPVQLMAFQRVAGGADADRLAARLAGLERRVSGNTGIGGGVWAALDLLDRAPVCAARRLVNLSGDGRESLSPRPHGEVLLVVARARAVAMGVTINALAITTDDAGLTGWYAHHLITGPDGFVMQVTGFADFAEAIAAKLAREIAPPALAELSAADASVWQR